MFQSISPENGLKYGTNVPQFLDSEIPIELWLTSLGVIPRNPGRPEKKKKQWFIPSGLIEPGMVENLPRTFRSHAICNMITGP